MRRRLAARLFGTTSASRAIGRFEVLEFVGAGGMGAVYLARDPSLGRSVAIKLLHSGHALGGDSTEHERLLREAHALAALSHPNVVQLHEVGAHEGRVFLAMEYVEGAQLRQWQSDPARTWREILRVYLQAAEGLIAAHAAGIVHRDFKPSNVIVGREGRVRVADFGLARAQEEAPQARPGQSAPPPPAASSLDESLTQSGAILGTPAYMAPEQLAGAPLDTRADQWSFCVSLWEALYGVRPYGSGAFKVGAATTRPLIGRARGPRALRATLQRGLCVAPGDRWPTMRALCERLSQFSHVSSRRGAFVMMGGVSVGGLVALLNGQDQCPPPVAAFAEVWDEAVRADLSAVLSDERVVISQGGTERLLGELDRFRVEWLTTHMEVCRATVVDEVRPESYRASASACLDLGLVRVRTAVDLLREGDAAVIAQADAMVDALGDPRSCLEVTSPPTSPDDDATMRAIEKGEIELAAGRVASAESIALAAVPSERGTASALIDSAALSLLGRARTQQGRAEQGTRDLLDAVNAAEAGRHDRIAAQSWLALVDGAVGQLLSLERAQAWLERSRAAVARMGDPPDLLLLYRRAAGLVARERGDWASARAETEQAVALADASVRVTLSVRARLEMEMADVESHEGDTAAALTRLTNLEARLVPELGGSHPLLADLHIYLGRVTRASGKMGDAASHFAKAAQLREDAYGSQSSRVSTPLLGLADAHLRTGDVDAAKREANRAALLQQELPAGHVERGGALALLGAIAQAEGAHEEAALHYSALAEEWRTGPRSGQRPMALNNAAWSLTELGRTAEARALYATLVNETQPHEELHAIGVAGLGWIDHLAGEHEHALVELESALGLARDLEKSGESNPELVPEVSWHLAEVLDALGREPSRRCELARGAAKRYHSWPERESARTALLRMISECPTPVAPFIQRKAK